MNFLKKPSVLLVVAIALAGGAGFLAAEALSQGAPAPTKTVTVDVGTGATGPVGPQGPQGPEGSFSCLAGYSPGILVINAPGGQTRIYTCIHD